MERQIKGIFIPIEIWENKDLSWNEKILLMEIDSFTSKNLPCFFSNEYIADLLGVKENTASILLSRLVKKGYVRRVGFNGRERYVESLLHYGVCGDLFKADFDENQTQTLTEVKHNSSSIIDTSKKDNTREGEDKKKPKTVEEKREAFRAICDKYVEKYGKQMVDEFFLYWSEANGNQLRCEIAKKRSGAFEVGRRLATWASKEYNQPRKPVTPASAPSGRPIWESLGMTREQYLKMQGK